MGTDIHPYVEVMKDDGKWEEVRVPNPLRTCSNGEQEIISPVDDRDYQLFGILSCGVRSEDYPSIDEYARGLPKDVSCTVASAYCDGKDYWHGASWYSLKELQLWAYDEGHFFHPVYDDMTGQEVEYQKQEDASMLDRFKRFVNSVEFVGSLSERYIAGYPERLRVVFWFDS